MDNATPKLKLAHADLFKVTRVAEPGMPENNPGVCYGTTANWLEAILTGEDEEEKVYDSFDDIFEYINQNSQEKNLSEKCIVFAKKIAHRQDPSAFTKKFIPQHKGHTLQPTRFNYQEMGIFAPTVQELENYLLEIESQFQKQPQQPPVAFMIHANQHVIGLYYHLEINAWIYFNVDRLYPEEDYHFELNAKIASKLIFLGFLASKENYLPLCVTSVSIGDHAHLITTLSSITDKFTKIENKKNSNGYNCFWLACEFGMPELIEKHINAQALENINTPVFPLTEKITPLHIACQNGNVTIVQLLLASGAQKSINLTTIRGQTPLYIASEKGHADIVNLLLKAGAKPNPPPEEITDETPTPLYISCQQGHNNVVERLLENGAKTDLNKELFIACQKGDAKIVSLLLTQKAVKEHINALNPETQTTCLWISCLFEHHDIIQKLLENGAAPSIHILDMNNESPLSIARENNKPEVVKLLSQYLPKNDGFLELNTPTPLIVPQFDSIHQKADLTKESEKNEIRNKITFS